VRQVLLDGHVGLGVALGDEGLHQPEEADRGDDAHDGGGFAQGAQDQPLEQQRDQDRRHDPRHAGRERLEAVLGLELDEGDVGGQRAECALSEVHQARPAVDEHGPLGEQRVGGPRAEPDDHELQERLHPR
jgi:hypothetical protein